MKYKLLKDCPHGKAGSEWRMTNKNEHYIWLRGDLGENESFPLSTFPEWFEEIKELKKFTSEQTEAIKNIIEIEPSGSPNWWESRNALKDWLEKNTEY